MSLKVDCSTLSGLESSPESLAVFPHLFQLVYTVILSSTSLKVVLRVESPTASTLPLPFTTCIHSYFRLPSNTQPTEVTVSPLASLTYVDKVLKGELSVEERVAVVFDGPQGEIDRVYRHSPNELLIELKNDRNKIKIVKNNLDDVVIWNCGTAHTLGDMEEGGENRFVCVEPAQVSSVVSLNAGQSWEGSEEIICLDDALE
jgi:glucose-6-phosphate 1-epimerase